MTKKKNDVIEKDDIVVKFVGDSGDGMQLIGTIFSDAAAIGGNDLATFPDYPAEIRAPHNTIAGVSGFQVHFGNKKIKTSGDLCDVIIAMNPASLKSNLKWAKPNATIIVDADIFDQKGIEKAGYTSNPLTDGSLEKYNLISAPITTLTQDSVKSLDIDSKTAEKTRNMFALGILNYMFNRDLNTIFKFYERKFKKKPILIDANKLVLQAGYNYADTIEAIQYTYVVSPATMSKGRYRSIHGNQAVAWGLMAAAEKSGRPLFLGSYPITPATEILIELSQHKSLGVKVFQAEDEIAGICSAIGASFTGSLACTSTSGPGLSLKSEALGLAVMTELPLVIVNVQRGGPSTGLPTKSEQSDLYQALFGRNGEAPLVIIAASSPSNCFYYAFEAAKIAMEHMTPVILLTEGALGMGTELFRIPKMADMPAINPPLAKPNDASYKPYNRNPENLVRQWALPGTEGLRHRIGGLEKEDGIGNVSMDPLNHQKMTNLRHDKVQKVANYIPKQDVIGDTKGKLLVVGWGSTFGVINSAVLELKAEGVNVSQAHFNYIYPTPINTLDVLDKFEKILVCELNSGQFVNYLRMKFPKLDYLQYNKVQGLPFVVSELKTIIKETLNQK